MGDADRNRRTGSVSIPGEARLPCSTNGADRIQAAAEGKDQGIRTRFEGTAGTGGVIRGA